MREGICAYSGHAIPKGSGITHVRGDGKAVLFKSRKVRNFVSKKIKPRFIAWTQPARTVLKKQNIVKEQKVEVPVVVKIVRGFPSVPAHIIAERQARAAEKSETDVKPKEKAREFTRGRKVSKGDMRKK